MAPDYTIRSATLADLPSIKALNDLAFGGRDESHIVQTLHDDGDGLLSLIATTSSHDIIGHIQFFEIALIGPKSGRIAGLGPMCVAPNYQKSGIGSKLVAYGLQSLAQQGAHRIFVLGHADYYPKFGFSVDATAGFAAPWGGPAFMAIELNGGGPEFGELQYPAAFSED